MSNIPKVSVIMGVYNPNKDYLLKAVNSILNQTMKNFEFIICDDGSAINKGIFEELEKIDNRIKIIKNDENKGLAYSLNKCIEIAKGEYIARQDADDISMENRLQKQIEFLDNNEKYSFVGSNIQYLDNENIWGYYRLKENPKKKDFIFRVPFIHGTIIYRSNLFEDKRNLYRVIKETRRCEDYDLFMELYSKDFIGYNIQDYLYTVREDKNALNRRKIKYKIDEVKIRKEGFSKLKLPYKYYIFIFKPIIIGIIPKGILSKIKDIVYKRKMEK